MRTLTIATLITALWTVPGCGSDASDAPATTTTATGSASSAIAAAVADFNGDGAPDIAALDALSITVYYGPFDSDWKVLETHAPPAGARDIAAGDMDGDGTIDIMVAGDALDVILRPSGDTKRILSSAGLSTVRTLDVDGDSIRDIFASGGTSSYLLRGMGDAQYEPPVAFAGGVRHASADFNGDGDEDLVLAAGSAIDICDWNTLASVLRLTVSGGTVTDVVTADVNGDGNADIVAGFEDGASGGAVVFYGDGALGFAPATVSTTETALASLVTMVSGMGMTSAPVNRVGAADIDGDGSLDIACATTEPAIETRLSSDAAGPKYLLAAPAVDLECADFNGDGCDDLLVVNGSLTIVGGRP